MKKKLEAELISIAHRILKLKNRGDLDVLQQETLKLYEKISVLRFVEDNFSDVKPTIGYASAEETLEEIYGIEETPVVHANEQEAKEEEKKAQAKSDKPKAKSPKPEDESKAESLKSKEKPEEETRNPQPETDEPEGDADPEQPVEEYQASEEEKEHTEEETDEDVEEEEATSQKPQEGGLQAEEPPATSHQPQEEETRNPQSETEEPETEEPVSAQPESQYLTPNSQDLEAAAAAVYKKEDESTPEEEEQAADAEVITIAPDDKAKLEDMGVNFEFAFERTPAPEEPQKQKEITFEDFHDYKEPEFVKKGDDVKAQEPQATSQEPQEENSNAQPETPNAERDWRDWEPAKDEPTATSQQPQAKEKPQATSQQPAAQPETRNTQPEASTRNTQRETRSLNLGLNDRIAFEKYLFGGSGEDLNRVISQLNTFDSFDEAKEFIADMVKPDYNNWQGKEEYEERFLALVEKKFE